MRYKKMQQPTTLTLRKHIVVHINIKKKIYNLAQTRNIKLYSTRKHCMDETNIEK
jgi:hypothetical protein